MPLSRPAEFLVDSTGTVRWDKGVKANRVRVSPELIDVRTVIGSR